MPNSNIDPAKKAQLDFLLADFGALKAEIGRRSGLQRLSLAGYVALGAAVVGTLLSGPSLSLPTAGLWFGGTLTLLFWLREAGEIGRLGGRIRSIATRASTILAVGAEDIIPSEHFNVEPSEDAQARRYHVTFMWLLFFVLPTLMTLFVLWMRFSRLEKVIQFSTPAPYVAVLTLVFALWSVFLLRRC